MHTEVNAVVVLAVGGSVDISSRVTVSLFRSHLLQAYVALQIQST